MYIEMWVNLSASAWRLTKNQEPRTKNLSFMKSPLIKTALMGLIAAIISGIAATFYPWPEVVVESDLVGKPLFEAFDASSVRSISIIKYDSDRNGLDRIELRRSGEKWLIPAKQNFIANNARQISLAVNSLNGKVLENRSSDQQDHVLYGVVDPLEFESATNRKSLGTKVILQDRNNRELASLIVGDSPRNESQQLATKHFVRIPGQPNVYVMEVSTDSLVTDFPRWVNSDLLGAASQIPIETIEIKNYRLDAEKLSVESATDLRWIYRCVTNVSKKTRTLEVPAQSAQESDDDSDKQTKSGDNGLAEIELTPENNAQLQQLGLFLGNIIFTDVQRKSPPAAAILKQRAAKKSTDLDSLAKFGFVATDSKSKKDFGLQFKSLGGEVVFRTTDGVAITILIGAIVENSTAVNLSLNHYVMLYATVDESLLPEPKRSEPNEEETKSDDAEKSDAVKDDAIAEQDNAAEKDEKAYLRLVAAREAKLKAATQRAAELNQAYADWYYIVSESIINGLRPDLTIPAK